MKSKYTFELGDTTIEFLMGTKKSRSKRGIHINLKDLPNREVTHKLVDTIEACERDGFEQVYFYGKTWKLIQRLLLSIEFDMNDLRDQEDTYPQFTTMRARDADETIPNNVVSLCEFRKGRAA